jgi:hypothetical protein
MWYQIKKEARKMDTVTISQAEYDRLRADSTLLHLLEEEGVKE